jgi:uncharacterized protein (DUF1800 family)
MKTKATALITLAAALWLPQMAARSESSLFKQRISSKDDQALHALNRLTYGPRPGDVEAVQKLGLKKWIDQQLHPAKITESEVLRARLEPLESLRMTTAQITQTYPPPQMVVPIETGGGPRPAAPEPRATLERLAARYKDRLDKKNVDDGPLKPAEKEALSDLLSRQEIRTLRTGTEQERAALLTGMPADKLERVLYAMPQGSRRALFAFSPPEIRRKMLLNTAPQQVLAHDLWEGKLYRAVYSNRQLEEVLTDFWFNHFNVYLDKGADRYLVTSYERDAIRPHVLGKFGDMVRATAEHPAMLWYLDNWQSVAPDTQMRRARLAGKGRQRGINENYARELLELHTLGVDGGYTQKDITEIARCFTGWTMTNPQRADGSYQFIDRVHDKGEKVVLGVQIPAGGGKEDGLKVIDILAHHPSTARFVSRKLAQRFVADNPPDSLVNAMADTFRKTDGDIRSVLRTMLDSKEFWSQGAFRAKVKSPLEMVASAVRATGAEVTFAFGLANKIADLGQPLYRKQEPTGYSNTSEEWVNSAALLARMNFALALAQNTLPGVKIDPARFQGDPNEVARTLLFTAASAQTREAIDRGLTEKKEPPVIAGLILGSPEFQRR